MTIQSLQTRANGLAADARSLDALKLQAGQNTPGAIKEAARQFESLFMRELVKSMREATMKSGLFDSAAGDLGQDLLDGQLAVQLSGQPGGLSDMIARQLSLQMQGSRDMPSAAPAPVPASPQPASPQPGAAAPTSSQTSFVARHADVAARIERASGIPASFLLGQAGHESGWGRQEIRNANGTTSHNLFGIKAGAGWKGPVAEVTTTEFINGAPQKTVARFRAYGSYEESFRDFARLITQSPRYANTTRQLASVQGYANSLQSSGYATDPEYATKLSRAINMTLRVQRAQA